MSEGSNSCLTKNEAQIHLVFSSLTLHKSLQRYMTFFQIDKQLDRQLDNVRYVFHSLDPMSLSQEVPLLSGCTKAVPCARLPGAQFTSAKWSPRVAPHMVCLEVLCCHQIPVSTSMFSNYHMNLFLCVYLFLQNTLQHVPFSYFVGTFCEELDRLSL